jgi:hypothetical protein
MTRADQSNRVTSPRSAYGEQEWNSFTPSTAVGRLAHKAVIPVSAESVCLRDQVWVVAKRTNKGLEALVRNLPDAGWDWCTVARALA